MKKLVLLSSIVALSTVATTANAALDAAAVTAIQTEVLADVSTAAAAGFAVLGVVLATSVGFSLLARFLNKGASA